MFSKRAVIAPPASFTPYFSETLSWRFLQQKSHSESQPLTPPQVSISVVLETVQLVQ